MTDLSIYPKYFTPQIEFGDMQEVIRSVNNSIALLETEVDFYSSVGDDSTADFLQLRLDNLYSAQTSLYSVYKEGEFDNE